MERKGKRSFAGFIAFIAIITMLFANCILAAAASPFTDVSESKWSYNDILFAFNNGYMTGTGEGIFNPSGQMTRGMVVTVLYRKEGSPLVEFKDTFSDVEESAWYAKGVIWASEQGIVNGTGKGLFEPKSNITREQLAAIMQRYAKYKGKTATVTADLSSFVDTNQISNYAKEAIPWAVGYGLISGKDTVFGRALLPKNNATREEFAAILHRYIDKVENGPAPTVAPTPQASPTPIVGPSFDGSYAVPNKHSTYTAKTYEKVENADYYISTKGNDSAKGTKEEPLASFNVAKALASSKASSTGKKVTVAIMAGSYYNPKAEFTAADSNVDYVAYGDGEVIFAEFNGQSSIITLREAKNITFRGITFQGAARAFNAVNTDGITIDQCKIKDMSDDWALLFSGSNYRLNVTNSEFSNLAGGGIDLSAGDITNLISSECKIDNNLFTNLDMSKPNPGYAWYGAVNLSNTVGVTVSHNEISNTRNAAITYKGPKNVIEYNVIHEALMDSGCTDHGVIYGGKSLLSRNTVIRYNIIYNVPARFGTYGIYFDDGITAQLIYGNLFYNCGDAGICISEGRDHRVTDNVHVVTVDGEHYYSSVYPSTGWFYEKAKEGTLSSKSKWTGLVDSLKKLPAAGTEGYNRWMSEFPEVFKESTDVNSYEDPNSVINCGGCTVKNNFLIGDSSHCINKLEADDEDSWNIRKYSEVGTNYKLRTSDELIFNNPTAGDYTPNGTKGLDFPYQKIGRY